MTYEELYNLMVRGKGYDSNYTINNLSVKEVFYNDYVANSDEWFKWNDIADDSSIKEAKQFIREMS